MIPDGYVLIKKSEYETLLRLSNLNNTPQKPIPFADKQKANTLYSYMKHYGTFTKSEICHILGITNERHAREIISLVGAKQPVISTSNKKGYRLAKTKDDLDDAEHTAAELSSRLEEIYRRLKPIYDFIDEYKWGIKNGQ